jgi:hypothetical protein
MLVPAQCRQRLKEQQVFAEKPSSSPRKLTRWSRGNEYDPQVQASAHWMGPWISCSEDPAADKVAAE